MSVDVRPDDRPEDAGTRAAAEATGDAGETATAADQRNGVAVHFDDGSVATYAFVVRPSDGDWLHAERLVGDGDGLDEEEVEAINVDAVRRVRSADVHVVDGCAVHCGSGLLVDPDAIVAECGLD
ncbi:hypothetical protein ACKVMT_02365 [Halobacteriales archaeon Cl-PHB]